MMIIKQSLGIKLKHQTEWRRKPPLFIFYNILPWTYDILLCLVVQELTKLLNEWQKRRTDILMSEKIIYHGQGIDKRWKKVDWMSKWRSLKTKLLKKRAKLHLTLNPKPWSAIKHYSWLESLVKKKDQLDWDISAPIFSENQVEKHFSRNGRPCRWIRRAPRARPYNSFHGITREERDAKPECKLSTAETPVAV